MGDDRRQNPAGDAPLLTELGLLFLGLAGLGLLARRFGLSPIPFVLVAALALGDGGVVPLEAAGPFVELTAEIGVVLLLLTLGLEFSSAELFASLRRHGSSGVVDLLLNAPPGFVAGLLLGLSWQGSMALAGVTWISSSGIVARLLGDLDAFLAELPPGVLVTWHGAVADLAVLAARTAALGVVTGLRVRPDARSGLAPVGPGAVLAPAPAWCGSTLPMRSRVTPSGAAVPYRATISSGVTSSSTE